ncbi:MAG: hypothetical protein FJX68_16240 [Alphaproteobacteria bacterium]|nr:hypothetical protein [Alphaproteobacteria bacterium]
MDRANWPVRLASLAPAIWAGLAVAALDVLLFSLATRELSLMSRSELAARLALPLLLLGLAGTALSVFRARAATLLLFLVATVASVAGGELLLTAKAALVATAEGGAGAIDSLRAARAQGRALAASLSMLPTFRNQGAGRIASRLADERGELVPLAGIPNSETLYCRRAARWLSYRADELGFRNPSGVWQGGQADAVLLGDSFVVGHCVEDDGEFGALLRARLGKVLNLGQGGRGPLFQLATLVEYGPMLKPRIVLWFYVDGDDIEDDLAYEGQSALLRRYLEPGFSQGLFERRAGVTATLHEFQERALALAAEDTAGRHADWWREAATLAQLRGRLQMAWQALRPVDLALFHRVLSRAGTVAAAWQGQLVLVDLAQQTDMSGGRLRETRQQVHAIAGQLGIPLIELAPAFRAAGGALFQPGDGHYTAAGYALAAEHIARSLSRLQARTRTHKHASRFVMRRA